MPINGKNFEHRPISELMAIVRQDLRKLDEEGLIDEGTVIKIIMQCNERLGIPIREVKERCIPIRNGKAWLPLDFDKLYYVCHVGGKANEISYSMNRNPFDNNFDRDIIYEAKVDRAKFGNTDNYQVVINKIYNATITTYDKWAELEVAPYSHQFCMAGCPNAKNRGRKKIVINNDNSIDVPFEDGELYMMYVGNMKDEEGNLLFPFHPLITPYYEWAVKEKIIMDAIFNSDGNYGDLLKLAQMERTKAWIDAYNATMDESYGKYIDRIKKKELSWYNQYFKFFQ